MDRRQFIAAAIAAGGIGLLPETAPAELPILETSSPVMQQYDGKVVTFTWGQESLTGIVRFIEPHFEASEPLPPIYLAKREPSTVSFSIDWVEP